MNSLMVTPHPDFIIKFANTNNPEIINPFAPDFPEDLLPKHKNSFKIHKSLIYWYILNIFTGLIGITLD
jgi:hypothetical protein